MTPPIRWLTGLLLAAVCIGCESVSNLNEITFTADAGKTSEAGQTVNPIRSDAMVEPDGNVAHDAAPVPGVSRCLIPDGADCDPVAQCGCAEGNTCRAVGDGERPRCEKTGPLAPWSACSVGTQCSAGQTCDRGSCRPYCASDDDCDAGTCVPARAPDGQLSKKLSVCWKRCEPGEQDAPCADGTACRTVKNPFGDSGSYCVAPLDPCPTVEDGVCDDPGGNGTCARGTDNLDCSCSPLSPESACHPGTQCGCDSRSTCVATLQEGSMSLWEAKCTPAGSEAEGSTCEVQRDCAPGLLCEAVTNTCVKYCDSDSDCGEGACNFALNDNGARFGWCRQACRPDDNAACPTGNVCAEIDANRYLFSSNKTFSKSGNFCMQPFSGNTCVPDGICDDPTGTRICIAGADSADCCVPPGGSGACDPYKQCGCDDKPGTACMLTDLVNSTACLPPGPLPLGSVCNRRTDQCVAGADCFAHICLKYCVNHAECGGVPNLCVKGKDASGAAAVYGRCSMACDPKDADSCPAGTVCAVIGDSGVTACWVPETPCGGADGRCDEPRPGGSAMCQFGTDTRDCCDPPDGSACNPSTQCGCEHRPGTECRVAEGETAASCLPIHPEPLSDACESVSDPSCCNPPVVGSECDPVQQCGCEDKPNTHCQVVSSSGIGGCMPYGDLSPGGVCGTTIAQCPQGYDCHVWDGVCRKACSTHADCAADTDDPSIEYYCNQRSGEAIGHCMTRCDFDSEEPCVDGTRCTRFRPDLTLCFNPGAVCEFGDNQQCDDTRPGGSRICGYGYDPECE